jgi:hypothetical protein
MALHFCEQIEMENEEFDSFWWPSRRWNDNLLDYIDFVLAKAMAHTAHSSELLDLEMTNRNIGQVNF